MPQTNKIGVYPGLDPLEDVPLEATHVAAYGDNVYVTRGIRKLETGKYFLLKVLIMEKHLEIQLT